MTWNVFPHPILHASRAIVAAFGDPLASVVAATHMQPEDSVLAVTAVEARVVGWQSPGLSSASGSRPASTIA